MHLMSVQLKMKKHSSYVRVRFISSVFTVYHSASPRFSDQHLVLHPRADAQRAKVTDGSLQLQTFIILFFHRWSSASHVVPPAVPNDQKWKCPHPLVSCLTVLTLRNLMASWDYSMETDTPRARVHSPFASSLMGNEWRLFISSCSSSTGSPPTDREDDRWRIECAVYFLLALSWLPNILTFHLFVKRWCHKFLCTARSFPSKRDDRCCVGCSHCLSSPVNPHRVCGC